MKQLKMFLDSINYHLLIRQTVGLSMYYTSPFPLSQQLKLNMKHLDFKSKKTIQFFYLGESMVIEEFKEVFDDGIYQELNRENLLITDLLTLKLNGCSLISYYNYYVFADQPYYYLNSINEKDDVYIGPDSCFLSSILPRESVKNTLDLCSGTGIQGIILSHFSDIVDCVDFNDKAIKYAKINCELNNIQNINVIKSDLFDKLNKKQYDLIVSNPPFIPFSLNQDFYSVAGAGGKLGLDIIDKILTGVDKHLNENGKFLISGETVSSKGEFQINTMSLKKLPLKFDLKLYVFDEMTINKMIKNVTDFCINAYGSKFDFKYIEKLKKELDNNGITNYHRFLLIGEKVLNNESRFEIIQLYKEIDENSVYELNVAKEKISFKKMDSQYVVTYRGKDVMYVDDEVKKMIEEENFEISSYKKNNNYDDIIAVIRELEKTNIIRKKGEKI